MKFTTSKVDLERELKVSRFRWVCGCLPAVILLFSAFHFWPFTESRLWQYAVAFNSLPLIFGGTYLCLGFFSSKFRTVRIPEVLVIFVLICGFSLINTPDIKRTAFYTTKIFGSLIGLYILLMYALTKSYNLKPVIISIIVACFISVTGCLFCRIALDENIYGFHVNAYKYATFISILGGFAVSYLILQKQKFFYFTGCFLVILMTFSAGTIGLIISLFLTLAIMALICYFLKRQYWYRYVICLILCIGCLFAKSQGFLPINDMRLDDGALAPVKQRYIEWQAEINILKDRIVVGCGAGAINTYRSKYYGQLPKLNTLEAFDQNGYLATAAELGLLGLFALVWMLSDYFRKIFTYMSDARKTNVTLVLSCLCSLIAATVANLFSSVFYNGVLVSLVVVFVLIDYSIGFDKDEQV